jgi:hypothetical protein
LGCCLKVEHTRAAFVKGDPLARLAGAKGVRRRWAKATPAERAEVADTLNRARLAKYVRLAHTAAAANGSLLTEAQALIAADALWQADLAERRLLAWQKRREGSRR